MFHASKPANTGIRETAPNVGIRKVILPVAIQRLVAPCVRSPCLCRRLGDSIILFVTSPVVKKPEHFLSDGIGLTRS